MLPYFSERGFKLEIYNFIKLKPVCKGLIVIEKRRLGYYFFSAVSGVGVQFYGPKSQDTDIDKQKGGHPFQCNGWK